MKHFILFYFLFLLSIHANTLHLTALENCPYSCHEEAKNKGFLVDIITHIYKKAGYTIVYSSSKDDKLSLERLEHGDFDLMIGLTSKKSTLIYMKKPLAYTHNVIVMHKASKWHYSKGTDLNQLQLAVIQELMYSKAITKHIKTLRQDPSTIQIESGHLARKHNLKKLRFHKVTALIDDKVALRYFYYKKKKPFNFKIVHTSASVPIHIAFSPKGYRAKKYSNILYKGMKKFKESQEIKDIMKKYGLTQAFIKPTKKSY